MYCSTAQQKILLSAAPSDNKTTTNGYKIIEVDTIEDLPPLMNSYAVAVGMFANGHRNGNYLKACGNVYFVDIDSAPATGEAPYYQAIEEKLRSLNITFASVPSKSADRHIYKRHIAIILDAPLPVGKKAFTKAANYILDMVGIDTSKIDKRVAFNNVAFVAPASINKSFTGADEVSNYHDGQPLYLPEQYRKYETATDNGDGVSSTQLIKFADGSAVPIFEAKKIISPGESKSCYCPNPAHDDQHPSATFYHNANGRVKIFCAVCGSVKIGTNFIPTTPTVSHQNYNYSIIVKNAPSAKISSLAALIGECTTKTKTSLIWCYSVTGMSDIYALLLAKVWLVNHGFNVLHLPASQPAAAPLHTQTLHPITKNISLPTAYIPHGVTKSAHYYRYKQMAVYVYHNYLFAEAAIYATYQNLIDPTRSFESTCNLGLAYFDLVLDTIDKQKHLSQSDKIYPIKLTGEAKANVTKQRLTNMKRGTHYKMTTRQKKLLQMIESGLYEKPNGKPNLAAIAKKMKVSRQTLSADMQAIFTKAKKAAE